MRAGLDMDNGLGDVPCVIDVTPAPTAERPSDASHGLAAPLDASRSGAASCILGA